MVSKAVRRHGVYVLPLLLLAGIAGIFFFLSIKRPPPPSAPFVKQEMYWRERIREVGGAAAYKEFAISMQGMDLGIQHHGGHIFGDALYTEVGPSGMDVCDYHFSGCIHQLVGRAVAEDGVSAVALLDRSCKGDFSCQHGIGHGIVSALGYTFPDLKKALALCHALPDDNPPFACERGVFMEYNLRLMLNDHDEIRPLDADWLDPCDRFSGDDAATCYLVQSAWWATLWSRASETAPQEASFDLLFKHMADLCHSISDKTLMYACIAGTGLSTAFETSPKQAAHLCDAMYTDAGESLLCRVNVAVMFLGTASSSAAADACQGLSAKASSYCLSYVNGQVSLPYLVKPPRL